MGDVTHVAIILRLLGAVIIGFVVGAQRAHTAHPAGIRTHILVALGSCVVMIVSCILYQETIAVFGATPSDPARLGAQVINGIGFLGAGAIMREGVTVRGLTTAASIWAVACLGLAVGMGYYFVTFSGTLLVFITLVSFDGFQKRLRKKRYGEIEIRLECESMDNVILEINRLAEQHCATVLDVSVEHTRNHQYVIGFRSKFENTVTREATLVFLQELSVLDNVCKLVHCTEAL